MISKDDINVLPDKPGVYFFRDRFSQILYIGKAKFLRKRVSSYTYPSYRHSKRTRQMVRKTKKVDYILCGSELEALLLESRLIKEHLPEYNIMQRRTRDYPFIKITMNEDFPRVFVTWEIEPDGAKYMGPFPGRYDAQVTVDLISKIFPIRKCSNEFPLKERKSPCLNFHIKQCPAPCCKKITIAEYRKIMGYIIRFLAGNWNNLIRDTEKEMQKAALELKFERAARLRDQVRGIKEVADRHQFRVKSIDSNNLIAIYPSEDNSWVEMFFIKKGMLEDQKRISSKILADEELSKNLSFDIQKVFFHHDHRKSISRIEADGMNIIARWLYRHRNDQSLVYIKGRRNKLEIISRTAQEVKKVIQSLTQIKIE